MMHRCPDEWVARSDSFAIVESIRPRCSARLIAVLAWFLVGCAPSVGSRSLAAGELPPPGAEGAREIRTACEGARYRAPATANLAWVDVSVRSELKHALQPIDVCLLFDGVPLFSETDRQNAVRRFVASETFTRSTQVTIGSEHELVVRAEWDATIPAGGRYHFVATSKHAFTLSASRAAPRIDLVLLEQPERGTYLHEQIVFEWSSTGLATTTPSAPARE